MTQSRLEKLLVTVDGSDRSILTMNFLASLEPFRHVKITLFNVFSQMPESFYDLRQDPVMSKSACQMGVWEISQRQLMQAHMDKCKQILVEAGFDPGNIRISIHRRKQGVARDILSEAQKAYGAVVLRRRGMSNLKSLVVGSVAYKLIHYLTFLPLIFAGRKPFNRRILIAVDGSAGAMRAVDFIGRTIGDWDCHVGLVGVYRDDWATMTDSTGRAVGEELRNSALSKMQEALATAKDRLVHAGCTAPHISSRVVTDSVSRAGSIVDMAEKEDYSTIVLGRKGISRVRKFALGRVGSKVLHIAREHSLWVVS